MPLRQPESMDECVYFTRRAVGKGFVMCWVFKEKCPKCGKAFMGKPRDPKTGDVKIRAKEYVCPSCNYTVEKTEYEDTLTASIAYTCLHCSNKGETQIPFKRKTFEGAKALVFQCDKCKGKIPITKKMKETGKKDEEVPDEE
jgi:predicted SprT family Zn-dependent metalloprotease